MTMYCSLEALEVLEGPLVQDSAALEGLRRSCLGAKEGIWGYMGGYSIMVPFWVP